MRTTTTDVRDTGAQVERLLGEFSTSDDVRVQQQAEELVRLLTELYGAGLERVVEFVESESGPDGLTRMAGDELVASLLILHGLHPKDTATRVSDALEEVRPYLGSHSGDVELLGVDDEDVAHLRLRGSCDGCPSSTVTVKYAIEGAVANHAPEVTGIDVQESADGNSGQAVIPVGALFQECAVPGEGVAS